MDVLRIRTINCSLAQSIGLENSYIHRAYSGNAYRSHNMRLTTNVRVTTNKKDHRHYKEKRTGKILQRTLIPSGLFMKDTKYKKHAIHSESNNPIALDNG